MHFIKNGHYYKILHGGKYYRLINPRRLFLFTIIPYPADATVTLTAAGYTQAGNTISVRAGTQVSWAVSKAGIPTSTGTETITEPKTIYVTIGYPSGTLLFESSTPGTYTLNVLYPCAVHIDMVGGGSGGASYYSSIVGKIERASGGGSGAYITGNIDIPAGGYSVVVGSGGAGATNGGTAGGGGATTFFNQTAGGGTSHNYSTGGSGGSYAINVSGLTGRNGNKGGGPVEGTAGGGASLYGGYGAGGSAYSNNASQWANSGGNGYVKIYVE